MIVTIMKSLSHQLISYLDGEVPFIRTSDIEVIQSWEIQLNIELDTDQLNHKCPRGNPYI